MKYITAADYLKGRIKLQNLTPEQLGNLNTLIPKINDLLDSYQKPITINSGYRSPEDQLRINPKVPHSNHIICAAIDIGDPDHNFKYWCLTHLNLLESIGLWMEDPAHTINWIHLQIIRPKSGKRIFIP